MSGRHQAKILDLESNNSEAVYDVSVPLHNVRTKVKFRLKVFPLHPTQFTVYLSHAVT